MKKYVIQLILLLLVVLPLMGIPYEKTEEYARKQAILDEEAASFKAETGFDGYISYNHNTMKFSKYQGNFRDILVTAPQDTVLMDQVYEQVFAKIRPYISAREGQLSEQRFTRSNIKEWVQKVNGYSVHPGGSLRIRYNIPTREFVIIDNTVDIPNDPVPNMITKEDAERIMYDEYKQSEFYDSRIKQGYQEPRIGYIRIPTSKDPLQYRLCWSMMFIEVSFSIDVETLEIHEHKNMMIRNNYTVKGKTYKPSTSGLVFGPTDPPESPLKGIYVVNGGQEGYTDQNGHIQFSLTPQENYKVSLRSERWDIRSIYNMENSLNVHDCDPIDPSNYKTIILDAIDTQDYLNPTDPSMYAANIYFHLQLHNDILTYLSPSFSTVSYPIIYNDNPALPANDWGGVFYINPYTGSVTIHYANGYNPYIIRHELSHFFTFNRMGNIAFSGIDRDMSDDSMDEAFAEYWLGRGLDDLDSDSNIRNYNGSQIDIDLLSVYSIYSTDNNLSLPLDEDFYSWYYCGMPIASAWDEIRTFASDFDSELLDALNDVDQVDQHIYYKPRYFYNLLMQGSSPVDQQYIEKAYLDRGFQFSPKVESYSVAQKPRNSYSPGNEVYVNITQAPQNTPFKVYVIKHGTYNYANGAATSTLNTHYASDFTPVEASTDVEGKWRGQIWSIPTISENAMGDYDIVVDFGSPEEPDGRICYAYTAADVMDGFDGRTEPGFKVIEPPVIDIVLALDCSPSQTDRSKLARTARQFVAQLQDFDRVGVFGFAAEVDQYEYLHDVTIKMIPNGAYGLTQILNNKDYLCGPNVIYFPNTYPYITYSTDMRTPFVHGYQYFNAQENRPKHFVTLSDGWHCLPDNFAYHNPTNEIHSRISLSYVPSVQCHTMRYKAFPTNNTGNFPYDEARSRTLMNKVAEWGNGTSWSRIHVSENYGDINSILDDIRHSSSSVDQRCYYTGQNPAHNTEIIQFVVDKNAHSFSANFAIDWYCTENTELIDFSLVSPSGIDVTQNPDYYRFYTSLGRAEVPFPEEGLWEAIVTRPPTNTSVTSFSFSAKVQSDLETTFTDPPRKHVMNTPLPLTMSAFNYLEPVTDAQVKVYLQRDDWSIELSLFDDGFHNDGQANDGIYSNYLYAYAEVLQEYPYNAAGMYDLLFELSAPSLMARRVKRYRIELEVPAEFPYSLTGRTLHKGWNWVGYPRLQRDEIGASINYANVSVSPYLTDIVSYDGIAEYRENHWNYYGLNSLKSTDGYKLRVNDIDTTQLFELGTIIDTLMVHPLYEGKWNWLTYPCYATVYPWEALSGVIDNIDYIMAEDWSMKKDGDIWIHDGFSRPHLKYGDSIMIQTVEDCSFVWNNPLTIPVIAEPQKPSYFAFEDKPVYETIMIESIEGNPDYTEIGVLQDDVCIGARVNEAYPIQILAYSTPEEDGGGGLSFVLYSESKGIMAAVPATIQADLNIDNPSTISPMSLGFRRLKLKTVNQQIPTALALHSNYPNPFNPSTTISFSVPTGSRVKLSIYNIRGQKVRELVNHKLETGKHNIIWDGRDDRNKQVGSGIYFARLEQQGRVVLHKMMLIK